MIKVNFFQENTLLVFNELCPKDKLSEHEISATYHVGEDFCFKTFIPKFIIQHLQL